MKRLAVIMTMLIPLFATACNTMAGAGEDLSKGGQKLEKTAEEHKHY
jgi:entericidin B